MRHRFKPTLRLENLEAREVPAVIGGLDPAFGTSGITTLDYGDIDRATAAAVQADGKIIVVGTTDNNNSPDFAVARFNPDGTPDTSFSDDGKVAVTFGSLDYATGVAIQADGKIVVVGYTDALSSNNDFAAIRLNPDGTLDDGFGGGDGKVTVGFNLGNNNDDRATAVAIQDDGKIVIAGSVARTTAGDFDFGVTRLNPDGTPDNGFSNGSKRVVFFDLGGSNEDIPHAIAIQEDGKIVIAGHVRTGSSNDFAAARLQADGTVDNSFGATNNGRATVDFGSDDRANAIAIRPDGRIVLAGSWDGGLSDFAVAQLTSAGVLDTTFGGGPNQQPHSGKTHMSFASGFGGDEYATGVAIQPDGKILVSGRTGPNGGSTDDFGITRFLADGSGLDATFGANGKFIVDFGGDDEGNAMTIDANGRIILAGESGGNFAIARVIGTVEQGSSLAIGGNANGGISILKPNANGQYDTSAVTNTSPFGNLDNVVLRTAVADVNGDGIQDTITVTGPGTPIRVTVVNGANPATTLVPPFDPFGGNFTGGGFVEAADLDGNGHAEFVITPDQGGGPRVSIYELGATLNLRANFFGIDDPDFRGGARSALGDVNADGVPDLLVAAGFGGGPRVALYNGKTLQTTPTKLVNDFFAFPGDAATLRNGTFAALGDFTGDGYADLVFGGGPGGAPRILILDGQKLMNSSPFLFLQPVANFFVNGNADDRGGIRVAVKDADGDSRADLAVGSGENSPANSRIYLGKNFTGNGEPGTFQDLELFNGSLLNQGIFVG